MTPADGAELLHAAGLIGLVLIFLVGTLRPINLGILSFAMLFIVGTVVAGENLAQMYSGFPVDLFILLVGVTYLFAIAVRNGTIEWLVNRISRLVGDRRAFVPWIVFFVAAIPTTAGALGSVAVAMLAPIALRLATRYDIDQRMIGLMALHGVAAGNFSPLNVLGAILIQGIDRSGLELSAMSLFLANAAYNVLLGVVIFVAFGGMKLGRGAAPLAAMAAPAPAARSAPAAAAATAPAAGIETSRHDGLRLDQLCTILALVVVAAAALGFGLSIGFLALIAAGALHLAFTSTSAGSDKAIAWDVVLLICGIVTYVAALQRYGTVDLVGSSIAALDSPLIGALLICAVGAFTSAFASSAGILGAMVVLAIPFLARGDIPVTGLMAALAISATVVDSSPFSTAGALVVANIEPTQQARIYRTLLIWAAIMVVTAPLLTWLILVVPFA